MVSIAVSKMDMTELIFVVPGMEANGQYYRDVLVSQEMLPAITRATNDTFETMLHLIMPRTPLNS